MLMLYFCATPKVLVHTQNHAAYLPRKDQAVTLTTMLRILARAFVVEGMRPALLPEDNTSWNCTTESGGCI